MRRIFFVKHAKSSAALVSLGVHALLIIIALSFVAVTVITKEEKAFQAKPINRPKMNLRKLQVPVNIKKKNIKKPKLRKRIVVQPKLNQTMPDIKMPEINGIKGGIGGGASSLGSSGGIGFSMPEIEMFGIKGNGEKICIILDSSPEMMYDEMGGIQAYAIIKNELLKILDKLPPTAVFNIMVYSGNDTRMLFDGLVAAHVSNVSKVNDWLQPLNTVRPDMGSNEYGTSTLGFEGISVTEDFRTEILKKPRGWYSSAMMAMKQQADVVFLLSNSWGNQGHPIDNRKAKEWFSSAAGKRWVEAYETGKKLLEKENIKRKKEGLPPRVVHDRPRDFNKIYFPGIERPPKTEFFSYKPEQFVEAFGLIREKNVINPLAKSGLSMRGNKNARGYTFNVVHFLKEGSLDTHGSFKELTFCCNGEYQTIEGLEAIKSYVTGADMAGN